MVGDEPNTNLSTAGADTQHVVRIAELCPELPEQRTRVVEGEITVVWPYSLVTKSTAFRLVETDFRLRRDKGQVRIDFHGPAGKAVSDAVLEGGDTVRLRLDGAVWEKASQETLARPGTLEWQLRFTNRLYLHVRRAETRDELTIDIDAPEVQAAPDFEVPQPITPIDDPSSPTSAIGKVGVSSTVGISTLPAKRLAPSTFDTDEYASPAFLKRARVSYGSLFEGGLDIFMEGPKDSSRRKKPRFSMNSNWKYSSRTPSPEPKPTSQPEDEDEDEEREQGSNPAGLPNSSPTTNLQSQQMALDQPQPDTAKSPSPTQRLFQPHNMQPIVNSPTTNIPQDELERSKNAELPEDPLPTRKEGFTLNDGLLTASAAPQSEVQSLETVQDSSTRLMAESLDSSIQPQPIPSSRGALPTPVSSVLSTVPDGGLTLEAPTEGIAFSGGDYHIDISNAVPNVTSRAYDSVTAAIFTPVLDTATPEIHHTGPLLGQLPWTDYVEPTTSVYPPLPTECDSRDPVEIIDSSSPPRPPSEAAGTPQGPDDRYSHTSELQVQQPQRDDDFDTDEALEEDRADFKVDSSESEEGSDLRGDDYDLRNYDVAKADDEMEPENTPEPSYDDPDDQIADHEDLDAEESGNDRVGPLAGESDEQLSSGQSANGEPQDFDDTDGMEDVDEDGMEEEDDDDEGEDEGEDDDGYSGDDYDEDVDEEEPAGSRTLASQEPVVIDLLSDSEDEDNTPATAPTPAKSKLEPEVRSMSPEDKLGDDSFENPESENNHGDPSSPKSEEDDDAEGDGISDGHEELNTPGQSLVSQLLSAAQNVDNGEGDEMDMDKDDTDDRLFTMDGAASPRGLEATRDSSREPQPIEESSFQAPSPGGDDHMDSAGDSGLISMGEPEAAAGSPREPMSDILQDNSTELNAGETIEEMTTQVAMTMPTSPPTEKPDAELGGEEDRAKQTSSSPDERHVEQVIVSATAEGDVEDGGLVEPVLQEPVGQGSPAREERVSSRPPSQYKNSQEIQNQATTKDQTQVVSPTPPSPSIAGGIAPEELSKEPPSDNATVQQTSTLDVAAPAQPRQTLPEEQTHQEAELGSPIHIELPSPEQRNTPPDQTSPGAKTTEGEITETASQGVEQSAQRARSPLRENLQKLNTAGQDLEHATEDSPSPNNTVQGTDDTAQARQASSPLEDDITVEQQIMSESQGYQRTVFHPEASAAETGYNKDPTPEARPTQEGARNEKAPKTKPEREVLITVQSLRSWDHRRSTSSDAGPSDQPRDPSILLAKAPAPSATRTSREEARPRTATSDQLQDPSIALARASAPSTAAAASREDARSRMTVHVTRSMVDHADPSLDLARAPSTPRKSARKHTSPDRSLETPAVTQSLRDRSPDTPATTNDVMNTPSVVGSTAEDEQASTLKRKLTQDLRNNLPEYVQLKAIRNHQKKTVEVMGVVTKTPLEPYRPKSGPRDYLLEVIITDEAAAPNNVVVAQLFRPHKTSLPTVQVGDVVVFRQFQTQPLSKRGVGLRTIDESSWAVFEKGDEEMLPQIKGPPVELSDAEVAHAERLRQWWGLLDDKARERLNKATEKVVQNPKTEVK